MHPRRLLKELSAAVPEGSIVATDVGNTCSMCNSYFRFSGARQFLPALSWGNCGIAYGVAMGAKVGRPDVPVFALQGDGAYGISGLSEVMTAVREEIPLLPSSSTTTSGALRRKTRSTTTTTVLWART